MDSATASATPPVLQASAEADAMALAIAVLVALAVPSAILSSPQPLEAAAKPLAVASATAWATVGETGVGDSRTQGARIQLHCRVGRAQEGWMWPCAKAAQLMCNT